MKKNIKISLCSVPVEGVGSKLDRDRSEGSLGIVPKVAIVSLVKWMENHGYSRDCWDFLDIDMLYPNDEELVDYFRNLQPLVVGLSAVVSTSYSQVKRIAKIIRKHCPNCWVVMGGNLAASSEAVLYNTDVDISVVGDGEIAWVGFLDYVAAHGDRISALASDPNFTHLKTINGLCFLEEKNKLFFSSYGEAIAAKDMPLPDYEILESGLKSQPDLIQNYFRNGLSSGWFSLDSRAYESTRSPNIAGIFASKGCVAKCTFCQRSTKGYRVQPYDELDAHLKLLKAKYKVGFIQILDENFGSNKKHSYEFAKILWENDMLWMATGVRCTSISEEDIVFYKDHGCSALKFGVESGSQKIIDIMEKVFTIDDVYNAVNLCIKHNIYSPLAVMVGMPGEDEITAQDTGRMIGTIAATLGVAPKEMGYDIFYALPLPGTPLYEYGEYMGVIDATPKGTGEYLERVTNAGTYKRYYVNLNGASLSEVTFWDIAVALEASRTYRHLQATTKILNAETQRKYKSMYEARKSTNPRFNLKYTALEFTFITRIIDQFIIGNFLVDRLPRKIIYPIIKYLNYFEFCVQRLYKKNISNNIFAMSGRGVPRLNLDALSGTKSAKAKSLRGVVGRVEMNPIETKISFMPNAPKQLLNKGL